MAVLITWAGRITRLLLLVALVILSAGLVLFCLMVPNRAGDLWLTYILVVAALIVWRVTRHVF